MSELLSTLLETKHAVPPSRVRDLAASDRRSLIELARDPGAGSRRRTALLLLSMADPDVAAPLLEAIVDAEGEEEALQAIAADLLARGGSEGIEPRLLRLLARARGVGLRTRLVSILGRIGGPAAETVLEKLAADPSRAVRRSARFAARLLRLRAGQPPEAQEAETLALPTRDRASRLRVVTSTEEETRQAVADVRGFLRGVDLDPGVAQAVPTPAGTWVVLWTQAVASDPVRALRRPGIAGFVAGRDPGEDRWKARWIVTSQGSEDGGIGVTVFDVYGDAIWAGSADRTRPDDGLVVSTLAGHSEPLIEATVTLRQGRPTISRLLHWDGPGRKRRPRELT